MKASSVLMLGILAALCGCGGTAGQGGAAPAAPEVGVMTLAPEAAELSTELAGRTAAFRIAEVRPQVEGIVQRRLFTEGAEVRAGQSLYQIDSAPYRAAMARAEAGVVSSEAQLNAARLLAERSSTLAQSGVVSKQENDNAAAADRSAAAAVVAAKAQLESARIDLAYTQVRSPISGRISRSLVTEGALVTKGQTDPLATVAQLDPIYVDVTQSSTELLRLQRDFAAGRLQRAAADKARVTLTLEDGSRYAQEGSLQFAEVTVDPGTGSVLLRAEFPNPDRVLLPGMFVRARLPQGSTSQALLLPQSAVTRNARGEATVLVVDADDKVSERVIQVDRVVGNRWLVSSGVEAGERVIVEGLQKARPGQAVKPMPVATAQALNAAAPAATGG